MVFKNKASAWLQALPHYDITTWKECIQAFTQRFLSFNKLSNHLLVMVQNK
jgi:hypothetical protein